MAIVQVNFGLATRDAKGWSKAYRYFITADNGDANFYTDVAGCAQALQAAIVGLTNASLQRAAAISGGQDEKDLSYGSNSQYAANWMQARMMFTTAKGTRSIYGIGAPKIALFDTDGITILNDGTQALVVAYVNSVKNAVGTAFVSTEDGLAYTHFVGGILKIGKQPRRFNELVKSSHLIQGEGE
jgi:hypothetical protein